MCISTTGIAMLSAAAACAAHHCEYLQQRGQVQPVGGTINYTLDEIPKDENHAVYRFTVQDTGIGMSEEFQRHIYEPFMQENEALRSELKGTGWGWPSRKNLWT